MKCLALNLLIAVLAAAGCSKRSAEADGGAQASGGSGGAIGSAGTGGGGPASGAGGAVNTCVDTSSDPFNCGVCGNVCGVVTLVSGQYPSNIAVDSANVYFTIEGSVPGEGKVLKMPLGGGNPTTLVSGQVAQSPLAVDSTSLYWTNALDGTVMKVALAGGSPVTLATGQFGSYDIAVDATSVYWTNFMLNEGGACEVNGTVMKVPLAGGTPITLASCQPLPHSIAVDATSVYWANSGLGIGAAGGASGTAGGSAGAPGGMGEGTVMKVPLAGGTPTTIASRLGGVERIAVDATSVYWTSSSGGTENHTLSKAPLGGGAPTILVSGPYGGAIAVDATSIYWASSFVGGGSVMRMPLAGGSPITLASGVQPEGMVIDATNVYWTNRGGQGSVMKLGGKTCQSGVCAGCPGGSCL